MTKLELPKNLVIKPFELVGNWEHWLRFVVKSPIDFFSDSKFVTNDDSVRMYIYTNRPSAYIYICISYECVCVYECVARVIIIIIGLYTRRPAIYFTPQVGR